MRNEEMDALLERVFGEVRNLRATKGKDYAGDADVLNNFKQAAQQLGLEPEQIWAVYAHKHWSAVVSYCRNGQTESEPIAGRIMDIITYCTLLLAMVEEKTVPEEEPPGRLQSDPPIPLGPAQVAPFGGEK